MFPSLPLPHLTVVSDGVKFNFSLTRRLKGYEKVGGNGAGHHISLAILLIFVVL